MEEDKMLQSMLYNIQIFISNNEFESAVDMSKKIIESYPKSYHGYWELAKLEVGHLNNNGYGYCYYVNPDHYYFHNLIEGAAYIEYYKQALNYASEVEIEEIKSEIKNFTTRAAINLEQNQTKEPDFKKVFRMEYKELLEQLRNRDYSSIINYYYEPNLSYDKTLAYIGFEWTDGCLCIAQYFKRKILPFSKKYERMSTPVDRIDEVGNVLSSAGSVTPEIEQIIGKDGGQLTVKGIGKIYIMYRKHLKIQ